MQETKLKRVNKVKHDKYHWYNSDNACDWISDVYFLIGCFDNDIEFIIENGPLMSNSN